jgi:Tfp pilus assembly protein PilX
MNNNKQVFIGKKKQQGLVLIWAVVFLIVITILGLSAIRMSGIDTQIAGNSMNVMMADQTADLVLADASQEYFIQKVPKGVGSSYTLQAGELATVANAKTASVIQYETDHGKCPDNIATTSKMGCFVFRIEADARLNGTNVHSKHIMGWSEVSPP